MQLPLGKYHNYVSCYLISLVDKKKQCAGEQQKALLWSPVLLFSQVYCLVGVMRIPPGEGFCCCYPIMLLLFGKKDRKLKPWMITGLLGQLIGFGFCCRTGKPYKGGTVYGRGTYGDFCYCFEISKITLAIESNFLLLIIFVLVIAVVIRLGKKSWKRIY